MTLIIIINYYIVINSDNDYQLQQWSDWMRVLIGYISMSGNTEEIAEILKNVLVLKDCEVDMEYLDQIEAETMLAYDCAFIGTYTWGDGDMPHSHQVKPL